MTGHAKRMLAYYHSALLAQTNCRVDLKKGKYGVVSHQDFESGTVRPEYTQMLFREAGGTKKNQKPARIPAVLCAKAIRVIIKAETKAHPDLESLAGVFFVPCILAEDGTLHVDSHKKKLPWFSRDFLQPEAEPGQAVGKQSRVNDYLAEILPTLVHPDSWGAYVNFCKQFYESVTLAPFDSDGIPNLTDSEVCRLEKQMYLMPYREIQPTTHIQNLYARLLEEQPYSRLLESFVAMQPSPLNLPVENDLTSMLRHSGHISGQVALAPSQREVMNHATVMEDGEILAVNCPPGTGKGSMLRALAANMLVEHALVEGRPPVIVATSSSNLALNQILHAFVAGGSREVGDLEQRWIAGVNSLAVYMPSSGRVEEAKKAGFQWAGPSGGLPTDMDTKENLQESAIKMVECCNRYFSTSFSSLHQCKKHIHEKLQEMEGDKAALLTVFAELRQFGMHGRTIGEHAGHLRRKIKNKQAYTRQMFSRVEQWKAFYEKLPAVQRGLRMKNKIAESCRAYMSPEEKEFLLEPLSIESVTEQYRLRCDSVDREIAGLQDVIQRLGYWEKQLVTVLGKLRKNNVSLPYKAEELSRCSLEEGNSLLDSRVRHVSFWLAVHYYECCWVMGEYTASQSPLSADREMAVEKYYFTLAAVTPCLVMPLSMLPRHMQMPRPGITGYMYDFIDLLLIDQAGEAAPEIAACSFALAKKAVVLGDNFQMEPPGGLTTAQDQALALQSGVVSHSTQFVRMESYGLSASSSSVMWAAGKSCRYQKYTMRGLLLSEHRQCYDEIIDYGNQLVYEGLLAPQRGKGGEDRLRPFHQWPIMGYYQIGCPRSRSSGGTRYNHREAEEIARWLGDNYRRIQQEYPGESPGNLLAVLTPFKAQAACIRQELRKLSPELAAVPVGTVAGFSGVPRRIILFSPAYGGQEDCYWIDRNPHLMNLVVSQARNHFLFFGDMGCLQNGTGKASELLLEKLTFSPLAK